MDILLIAVTVVSLLVAIGMSVVAWRMTRQERERSAARIAALAAAAAEPDAARVVGRPMAVVAQEADPVAVGESRAAAPWTAARVSAFAAVKPSSHPRAEAADTMRASSAEPPQPAAPSFGDAFLAGAIAAPPSSGRQRGLAVAAALLFVAALGGGYWMLFGDRSADATVTAASATESPLELVSLRHERRGGRLAVAGIVRNPVAGAPVDQLAAVVFLFDQQGGFLTSARAPVDFLKLPPGDESPFVIEIDAPATVARYRVSFRTDAGVVPHVDRRGQPPIAASSTGRSGP